MKKIEQLFELVKRICEAQIKRSMRKVSELGFVGFWGFMGLLRMRNIAGKQGNPANPNNPEKWDCSEDPYERMDCCSAIIDDEERIMQWKYRINQLLDEGMSISDILIQEELEGAVYLLKLVLKERDY